MALVRPDLSPLDFVALSHGASSLSDAVRFIAHALPKREAVWWGWVCARRSAARTRRRRSKAALDATEKWIAQPSEDNRRSAMAAAQKAELGTAGRLRGAGGILQRRKPGPARRAPGAPGEFLAAKAVSGAVIFAAGGQGARAGAGEIQKFRWRRRGSDQPGQALGAQKVAEGFYGMPASRITDMHVCPMVSGNCAARGGRFCRRVGSRC